MNSSKKNKIKTGSEGKEPVVFVVNTTAKAKISEIMVNNKYEEVLYVAEESDNCLSNDKVVWLKICHIQLLESYRKVVLAFSYQLNDKHINLTQKPLKIHFLLLRDLHSHFHKTKITKKKYGVACKLSFAIATIGLLLVT